MTTDLYNFYWVQCFINCTTWDLHIKKQWDAEYKKILKADMDEMIEEWKNINRIFKPLPVLFYTDWKNWKINNYADFKMGTDWYKQAMIDHWDA